MTRDSYEESSIVSPGDDTTTSSTVKYRLPNVTICASEIGTLHRPLSEKRCVVGLEGTIRLEVGFLHRPVPGDSGLHRVDGKSHRLLAVKYRLPNVTICASEIGTSHRPLRETMRGEDEGDDTLRRGASFNPFGLSLLVKH
jgi:hypothetical protein